MIGRTLGRFRIVAPLGKGGMATVWRAHDPILGRDLAIKLLGESLAGSDEARHRFRREAHIAGRLDHPAIVAVYDSGETDDATWIAMALVEGETLAERLRRSLLPVPECVAVGRTVADALAYAHEQGAVHRDVSARNVMLGRDGRTFLLDFGLALARDTSRVTSSSATVGTAPYMAPEVLSGGHATARSDVYGLGIVLYEALTGAPPYAGGTPAAMISAVLNEPLRPAREWRPEISLALDALVTRCLARDPGARGSAADLARDLRRLEEDGGREGVSAATATSPTTRSRLAERLADRSGPTYLAVTPFEASASDAGVLADTRAFADDLTGAAAAAMSRLSRVHVVPADSAPADRSAETLRGYARTLGAQLLLFGDVRRSGTRLRVTWALRDPEAGLQIAGDALEGSALDPFELEERVLRSLRGVLPGQEVDTDAITREHRRDPAATEHYRQALRHLERHDNEASVDAAVAILERLIGSEGDVALHHAALARAYVFKHHLTGQHVWESRAAAAAARAAELAPDAPETLLALGDLHRVAGRLDEAEREYGLALAQRPGLYEARLGIARILDATGRIAEAEQALKVAIEQKSDDWRAHGLLGLLRFSHGRYEDALPPWKRVVELIPDHALAARNIGSILFHLDQFEEAATYYLRSLEQQISAPAYRDLGTVYFFLGRHVESEDAFRKCVALTPADPVNWGNLGNALRLIPGRESGASEALERAAGLMRERLNRNPAQAESWARLAGWLANLGRAVEARAAIDEALRRGPEDVHVMVSAGHVFLQIGDRATCLRWLGEALRRGYGVEGLLRSPELSEIRRDAKFEQLLSQRPGATGRPQPGPDGRKEMK